MKHCHQSTLTVTAVDRDGNPYKWSGLEFKGEVVQKKAWAETAAARAFLEDFEVQCTAADMDPAYPRQLSASQKRRLPLWREIRRAKRAAERQKSLCVCRQII